MAVALTLTGNFGEPERIIELERPMSVAEIISENDLYFRLPTIAVMGDRPVLRRDWETRIVGEDETIAFVAVPGGGGGDGGGKQIVGLIAALALSVAAPMIGGAVAGAAFGGSAIAANLVSGLVLLPSSKFINMELSH